MWGEREKEVLEKAGRVADILREFDTLRGRFWGHYGQARVCSAKISLRKERLEKEGENLSVVERMRILVEIHDLEERKRKHIQGLEEALKGMSGLVWKLRGVDLGEGEEKEE